MCKTRINDSRVHRFRRQCKIVEHNDTGPGSLFEGGKSAEKDWTSPAEVDELIDHVGDDGMTDVEEMRWWKKTTER